MHGAGSFEITIIALITLFGVYCSTSPVRNTVLAPRIWCMHRVSVFTRDAGYVSPEFHSIALRREIKSIAKRFRIYYTFSYNSKIKFSACLSGGNLRVPQPAASWLNNMSAVISNTLNYVAINWINKSAFVPTYDGCWLLSLCRTVDGFRTNKRKMKCIIISRLATPAMQMIILWDIASNAQIQMSTLMRFESN